MSILTFVHQRDEESLPDCDYKWFSEDPPPETRRAGVPGKKWKMK